MNTDTYEVGGEATGASSGKPKRTRKQKTKIALTVLGCILGVVVLLTVILAPIIAVGNKAIVKDGEQPDSVMENWQSYISDDALIRNIATPGSHDSGCIDMPWYASTQDLTFDEQLKRGVRYFDIRVNKSKNGYVIYHGPVNGVSYESVLEDIAEFTETHPTEFLILDFSHFKNGSEEAVFTLFDEKVKAEKIVNDTELTNAEFIDSLTMGDVRGKCLVLVDPEETDYRGRDYLFLRGNERSEEYDTVLTSLYKKTLNGKSAKKFVNEVIPSYIEQFEGIDEGLFVLQAQLTDITLVFGPRYREGKLIDLMNAFVYNLYDSESVNTVNIIMRDFVTCEKSALTLRLNLAKGLVKTDGAEAFGQMVAGYVEGAEYV